MGIFGPVLPGYLYMKRLLLLVALGIFTLQTAVAQQFRFGIGGGTMNQDTRKDPIFMLAVSPGVYFPVSKRTSFSLEMPLKMGYGKGNITSFPADYKQFTNEADGFAFNIPLMLNFNFGAGAVRGKKDTIGAARWSTVAREEGFGFFLGLGVASYNTIQKNTYTTFLSPDVETGYRMTNVTDIFYNQSTGVMLNAGVRFGVGAHKRRNLELRFIYMKGMTNEKPEVRGVTFAYVF